MRRRTVTAAAAALPLAGCGPFSTLDPAGGQAHTLASLSWFLIVLTCLITLVMIALVVAGARRRTGNLEEHLPVDAGGGKRWILIGGVAIPVITLSALFVITLVGLAAWPGDEGEEPAAVVHVTGHQWWWEVQYEFGDPQLRFATANEIHIPVGQPVRIVLESVDVIHSFWVPRLHGKLDLIPGQTNIITLEADEPGVYRGQCAEYCGVQHANMRFLVVAEPAADFEAWTALQRRPARQPAEPMLVAGREAFERQACALCHRIRGTEARATVAPDLTHFGGRLMIAGMLPNDRARLQAWITDAQSIKPGSHMPSLREFDGETLNAIAAYLDTLE